jgi:hypothetical protein
MSCHSCEYPITGPRDHVDVLDHGAIQEHFLEWRPFVLLCVTAFSSYLH